jgi:hypothetical protein
MSTRRTLASLGLASALAASACVEHEYVYKPVAHASAEIAGEVAASYAIPPEAPRGDVRIASFGFVDIAPRDAPDLKSPALHVREIVANNGNDPWTLDTRGQRLSLESGLSGGEDSEPVYFTTESEVAPPIVIVPPGGKRTIDLFFPVGQAFGEADELPAFDIVWTVKTPSRAITERTPFERIELLPRYYDTYPCDSYAPCDAPSYGARSGAGGHSGSVVVRWRRAKGHGSGYVRR